LIDPLVGVILAVVVGALLAGMMMKKEGLIAIVFSTIAGGALGAIFTSLLNDHVINIMERALDERDGQSVGVLIAGVLGGTAGALCGGFIGAIARGVNEGVDGDRKNEDWYPI